MTRGVNGISPRVEYAAAAACPNRKLISALTAHVAECAHGREVLRAQRFGQSHRSELGARLKFAFRVLVHRKPVDADAHIERKHQEHERRRRKVRRKRRKYLSKFHPAS